MMESETKSGNGAPKPNAFERIRTEQQGKLSKADEALLHNIQMAAHSKDKEQVQKHLDEAKEHSSWLYSELMKHPEISAILRELSIMGF